MQTTPPRRPATGTCGGASTATRQAGGTGTREGASATAPPAAGTAGRTTRRTTDRAADRTTDRAPVRTAARPTARPGARTATRAPARPGARSTGHGGRPAARPGTSTGPGTARPATSAGTGAARRGEPHTAARTAPRTAPPARRPAGGAPPGRTDSRRPAGRPRERPRPLPPHLWFAQALLDVLTGRRPLTALAGRVRGEAYQRLWQLHAERSDWRERVHGRTPYVRRCRAVATDGGALEVAAVVALDEDVVRAIAFRLEPGPGQTSGYGPQHWHCTDVAAR